MSRMTTETVTPSRTSYEPDPALGTITAAIAVGGGVIAAVSLIAIWFGWFPGWYRFAPLPLVAFGWLLAIRFTRDDRNIMGKIAGLEMDCADFEVELERVETLLEGKDTTIIDHVDTIEFLRGLLGTPNQTMQITDRNGTRIIPMHERDDTWRKAMAVARSATEDFGKLRGHDALGHTQDEQTGALKLMKHLGIALPRGTIWRLTVAKQQAIDLLSAYAVEGNAATPPASPRQDANPDDSASRQEVESGSSSGWVAAGEGS